MFFTTIFGWQYFVGKRTVLEGMCYVQYMDDPIFNCVLQIGYFWVTLTVMIVLYSGIYKVALTLQKKSEAKQKKMTSLVSMAGQTMTKIGIGMSKQQSIDSAKLFKSSDDDKKEGSGGGGKNSTNAKPTANQLSVNTTAFNAKQNEGEKDDDRSSSPAFPSDTDPSSETAREKGTTKSKGRGKKTKERKQKESKLPGKLGKKEKKNSISNANCIDRKKAGDKLLQNSVPIPPPPANTTVRSVNASRPSVTGNDLSGGPRRTSQAGRRPSTDGRRASQSGRRASLGRRKSKPEIDFNEFIYCGPVSVATNVNVNKAFEDEKGPKLVRSDTVASGEGYYTDDEEGEVDEDLPQSPDGDPIDPISFPNPPADPTSYSEFPDNLISPSTPNFSPPPPDYEDVVNDLGKDEQSIKNSEELLSQVNAFSPSSDHGNNFCIVQANGTSNRISHPYSNTQQHHQQQQDLHVTNFMTSCQPGEYLAPTNVDVNATVGNVTTTHFPVNSFDEIATTDTTTATNNLNFSSSSSCRPPDLGCGGGEFTQSPITNTNVFPNNCLTDSNVIVGQNGPSCDYNVSNSNILTPTNLGSPHTQATNPFLPLDNNEAQPMNFEHFNGRLSNSSSPHQQLQPNLASPGGSGGLPSLGTFETSPVDHKVSFDGVADTGLESQQQNMNNSKEYANNCTALAITAPPELLSGVRYIDQDSVQSPLSTDNLQLLVEPIMPIYQEPDSPVWKRRSLVERQTRQQMEDHSDPTRGEKDKTRNNYSNRDIKETCLNQTSPWYDNLQRGANDSFNPALGSFAENNNTVTKSALNNGPAPLLLTKPSMDTLDPTLGGHALLATASSNSSGAASTSGVQEKSTSNDNGGGVASVYVLHGTEGNGTTVTKLATADDIEQISREDSSLEFRSGSLRGRKVKHKGLGGESPLRGIVKSVSHRRSKRGRSKREKTVAEKQKSKSENRARKALRTITIILGAFLICWTPWHIFSMVIGFCPEGSDCIPGTLYDISYWLCYLNSPINPFCYAFANQQFKKAFIRIIKFDWHRT